MNNKQKCCWLPSEAVQEFSKPGMCAGDIRMWSDIYGCKEPATWNVSSENNGTRTSCDGHLAHICAKDVNTITPVNYPTTETQPRPTASSPSVTIYRAKAMDPGLNIDGGLPITIGYTSDITENEGIPEPERSNGGSGIGGQVFWVSSLDGSCPEFKAKGGTGSMPSGTPVVFYRSEPGEPVCACGTNCRRP